MNNQFFQFFKQLFDQLSIGQKIGLATITIGALTGIFALMMWANRPDYGLLYSNLDAGDAAEIVEDLKGQNIRYQLKDGGTTILVPNKDIYELRIKYAGQKLISQGTVGYEIFDNNNFGLTDFMQKINLKRALEGELCKTINELNVIQNSRIHLVMPEPTLFTENENKATASVIVKLKGNAILDRKQTQGIMHMVAAGVEGLDAENVVIMDSNGKILTDIAPNGADFALSSSQHELKQKVESYLTNKAQTMLDRVLGTNNAIVRVSALLIFDKISRTSEQYDPDNTAILSEERNEERSTKQDTSLFQRENVVTNYEINKIVEQYEKSVGDIDHLNIAVFINEVYQEDQNAPEGTGGTFSPRPDEEIANITEIVKNAVGFSESRNDAIVVQQLAFDRSLIDREKKALTEIEKKDVQSQIVKAGIILLGGSIIFFLIRSIFKKFINPFIESEGKRVLLGPAAAETGAANKEIDLNEDIYFRKLSPQAKAKLKARDAVTKEVASFTRQDPVQAARLMRYWLLNK